MVWRFDWQPDNGELSMFSDTDFAGCTQTRRSTSGGVAMRGGHVIKTYSQTQSTICLSSAEAELGGIVKAAAQGLGLQSVARDLGMEMTLAVNADASAAIGICRRRGLGKVRHLHVADLWVQDKVRAGDFALNKVPGAKNPSDLLTKHMDLKTMDIHLQAMNIAPTSGRAQSAPKLP